MDKCSFWALWLKTSLLCEIFLKFGLLRYDKAVCLYICICALWVFCFLERHVWMILPCDMSWGLYRLDLCQLSIWILPLLGVVILYTLLNLFSIPSSSSSKWFSVFLKIRRYLQGSCEILLWSRFNILWMFSGPLGDLPSLHLSYLGGVRPLFDLIWFSEFHGFHGLFPVALILSLLISLWRVDFCFSMSSGSF